MTDTIERRWESHSENGRRLFSQGDLDAAEQEFMAATREATSLGADNVRLASSLGSLGQIKYRQKDLEQAEALFRRALAIRERVLGADHFSLVQAINNLATLHYSRGELDQAAAYFARALEICDKNLGEKHPDVAVTLNNLARLHFRRNDFVAAAPLLMRLLAIKQEALGAHHPEVAVILTSLAKVRLAEGQHEDAEQLARRALLIREEIHQPGDQAIATSLETLADVVAARGLLDDEQRLRKRASEIRSGAPGVANQAESPPPTATQAGRSSGASSTSAPAASQIVATHTPTPATPSTAGVGPAAAPPPGPGERTTRSASLPWIEAPTSPALRRPRVGPITAPRPVAAPVPSSHTPARRPPPVDRRTATPIDRRAATPVDRRTTPRVDRRVASAVTGPVADARRRPRRDVILETTVARPRRSSLRLVVTAAALIACAAGGWAYFTGAWPGSRVTSSAGAALDPTSLEPSTSSAGDRDQRGAEGSGSAPRGVDDARPSGVSPTALTASPDPSYGAAPPVREQPPAAAYADQPSGNTSFDRQGGRSASAATTNNGAAGEAAAIPAEPTPNLSRINVDRITTAIGANAKARADSLGRKTITIKEPDFEKPKP